MASPGFLSRFGWLLAAIAAVAVWGVDGAVRLRHLGAADAYGRTEVPRAAAGSSSGYEWGQRARLQLNPDSYQWVVQTQDMAARGDWRVRHTDADNAPGGREVHWSAPLRWWLLAVAWLDSAWSGRSLPAAIEHAAGYANALLFAGFVLALAALLARTTGNRPAALAAAGLVCVAPVSSAFAVGGIDHHGLATACALLCVLGIVAGGAGWHDGRAGGAAARRWFMFSGVSGAVGLWISASTQIPVLVGLGLGALAGAALARRAPAGTADPRLDPTLWRWWGAAGGIAALACYLLEYFPGHLGWRLEVNHPLHALAWAGAGELLFRCGRWARGGALLGSPLEAAAGLAALAAVMAPAAVVLLAGDRTFLVADPLLWRLHVDYIEEFAPLLGEFGRPGGPAAWTTLLLVVTVLPLLAVPVAVWCARRAVPAPPRALLLAAALPAAVALAMTLDQKRWLHLCGALWLVVLVVVVLLADRGVLAPARPVARRAALAAFLAAVLLPYPLEVARLTVNLARSGPEFGPAEMRGLAARDVARWLRRRVGSEPAVLLADPTATTPLAYFGGFRGVGTLYWENVAGLHAAMAFAAADSPEAAARIARERGVTHVVLFSWSDFAAEAARLRRGVPAAEPAPDGGFLQRVQAGDLPNWLRPVPYRLPGHPYFADKYAAVLEVVPDQGPIEAGVGQARYLLANGDEPRALQLLEAVLAHEPGHLPALVTLAQVRLHRRETAEVSALWSRIARRLGEGAAPGPEERVGLALLMAAASRREAAREHLAAFWKDIDERALRRLPAGALGMALRLTTELDVTVGRPELRALAGQLAGTPVGPGAQ